MGRLTVLGTALQAGALSVFRHPLLAMVLAIAGMCSVAVLEQRHATQHEAALLKYFEQQRALNDSTQARTAADHQAKDAQLQGLLVAERQLVGKLVAGVAIAVPRRDTVIVHDTLDTHRLADGTRTATVHDSTFAGIVDALLTAPPFPAPLGATLHVTRPAFRPEVGFVKVGDGYVATVVWQGEHFKVDAPFFHVPTEHRWVSPYVGGFLSSTGDLWGIAGATVNLGHLHAGPAVILPAGPPRAGIAALWTF